MGKYPPNGTHLSIDTDYNIDVVIPVENPFRVWVWSKKWNQFCLFTYIVLELGMSMGPRICGGSSPLPVLSPNFSLSPSPIPAMGEYFSPFSSHRFPQYPRTLNLKKTSIFFDQNYDISILLFFTFFLKNKIHIFCFFIIKYTSCINNKKKSKSTCRC